MSDSNQGQQQQGQQEQGQQQGQQQGGAEPWYSKPDLGLSQETKDYLAPKNYSSLEDAIKAKRQFDTLARDRNALTGPQEGKLGEWDGWQKLGWEPDAAKYGVEAPKLKDGVPYDPEFHSALTSIMHANKVPVPLAKGIVAELGKAFEKNHEQAMEQIAREETAVRDGLKREWGQQYDTKIELGKRAAAALGVGQNDSSLLEDLVGTPTLLKLFARLGEIMGEDKLVTNANGGQGGFGGESPARARAERLTLQADKAFMASINDPRHPQHEANTAKRQRLIDIEAGNK